MSHDKKATAAKPDASYTTEDLVHLTDREHVRKRPGMYIGDTRKTGVHHTVEEILDLMLDCARSELVNSISVTIHTDDTITLCDDNTGCKLETNDVLSSELGRDVTNLESELCHLRCSRQTKFFGDEIGSHRGGMHGLSATVVNFLSSSLAFEACGESDVYRQNYQQGEPVSPVDVAPRKGESGTRITYTLDPEIFDSKHRVFSYERIHDRLEILAYLYPGLKTKVADERTGKEATFQYPAGIRQALDRMEHFPPRKQWASLEPIVVGANDSEVEFQVALQRTQDITSYVNDIHCTENGTHLSSFFQVLGDVLNEIGRREMYLTESDPLPVSGDYESQLQGMIAVRMKNPQWRGATKTRIGNEELLEFAEREIRPKLVQYFESHPKLARSLIYSAGYKAEARAVS